MFKCEISLYVCVLNELAWWRGVSTQAGVRRQGGEVESREARGAELRDRPWP